MPLLATHGLTKHYPGVRALSGVDFELDPGEVHVLFGENGAGKSTLIALLAGAARPTEGSIEFHGKPVTLKSVADARQLGISAVFQEFSLVPQLTVEQNLMLGQESTRGGFLNRSDGTARARKMLADIDFQVDPAMRVAELTRAGQQLVEIAKGIGTKAEVLILDEPTASLTDKETQRLFSLLRALKRTGVGVVYITHRMQEIDAIGDRITVLRDGHKIGCLGAKGVSHERLIEMMTGRKVDQLYPEIASNPTEDILTVQGVSTKSGVRNASIHVRGGEVVGIAGLLWSGKSELVRAVYGLERPTTGTVKMRGVEVTGRTPGYMLKRGLSYLPPDRKDEGLVLSFSSYDNIALPIVGTVLKNAFGFLKIQACRNATTTAASKVELAPRNRSRAVALLSGGNQQKVMFAKGLVTEGDVYIFDEPTVGVDVGTRAALYRLIQGICERGAAVVIVSSDLPEILHLCHRTYVMCRGAITGELAGDDITESAVLSHFFERN